MKETIEYYNKNSLEFYQNTKDVKMDQLYNFFLKYLPQNAKILDLGCGSGRDTKYFLENGYDVVAVDGSIEMVKLSTELTGKETLHMTFQQLDFQNEFNGVWACASLLHVPRGEMEGVLFKISRGLKEKGVLFASFKYGDKEEFRNGRFFNYYDEGSFRQLIDKIPYFTILETLITSDVREGREGEKWFSVILEKN
ncbi:Methyltransferase domain-containing protein [Anaerobranca californiensis DSM 14826]|jgi:SAM-dependent methyltransferase|uniref:Methyltransferase domain-containing protein n=1 Tax=Anaerobranca californiensis DSM 14826 TaxID=1120989 RepID=A0A1M6PBP0_9FIRM|nr:class I SAM-dependent methyltransferase [Anaerobranca californiensis]SHK05381.1 Methyltransferase domain-containing protein [Anaerobranca californiensis DSM 14826]